MAHTHHAIDYVEIPAPDGDGEVGGLNPTGSGGTGGRRAHVTDPSGNTLAAWTGS